MATETENIWPEVELSDSEDDSKEAVKPKKIIPNLLPEDVTEEDIQGAFPQLKEREDSESSSDEDKSKENKYLSINPAEIKKKYDNKLRELHLKRNEARKLNHQEVSAEDQRKKLPKNYEAMRRRAEWEMEDKNARQQAEKDGEDYERVKLLEETAEDVEIFERRKRKKKNQDPGFSDYATAQLRQYDRLTKQMKPDLEAYRHSREKLGETAFPSAHNVMYGSDGKCSEGAVDRMVADLEKQIEKRSKFHRRRQHHDDADIDYINEKNMKFNQKAERYYGQYTQEIKQNLERGTAI